MRENGLTIKTHNFQDYDIVTASNSKKNNYINVYIEGDGLAWKSKNELSLDPTPTSPIALHLSLIDNSKDDTLSSLWIGRPCQFLKKYPKNKCDNKYWSSHRFSSQIIRDINSLIDKFKDLSSANNVNLIGFSGGAAIASIIGSIREDINSLTTISGNLDHTYVSDFNGVSRLTGSINPIDFSKKLSPIPQLHIIGSEDKIIPYEALDRFLKKQNSDCAKKLIIDGMGHERGVLETWKKIKKNNDCYKKP